MSLSYIEALLAIAIFSFVPISIRYTQANPYTIGFVRLLIASIFVFTWWKKQIKISNFWAPKSSRLYLIGAIFFCHWITYFYAIKIGGASSCVLGMSTYGIQLIFYGSLFLGYKLRLRNYLSILFVIAGLILVFPTFSLTNNFTKGMLLGLVSASFYSLLPIIHQRTNRYFSHEIRIFSQFFIAFILFTSFFKDFNFNIAPIDWYVLLFLAVFGTLIAHSLWAKSTSVMPTYVSGVLYYVITPNALILSHFILGEELGIKQIIGAVLIISAAIYNIWSSHDF